jgi:hypothetical protein
MKNINKLVRCCFCGVILKQPEVFWNNPAPVSSEYVAMNVICS